MSNSRSYYWVFFFGSVFLFLNCQQRKEISTPSKRSIQASIIVKEIETDTFSVAYITGKFDPATHPDFALIENQYTDGKKMYLRKETLSAFIEMHDAAANEGIKLQIRSATRNFEYQKGIWERKWKGDTKLEDGSDATKDIAGAKKRALNILKYSSMPGTSRHHWGTDIDLNSFNNSWFDKGDGLTLYTWMKEEAHKFGFCQPYSEKGVERPEGYEEERWHWSYMPLSRPLTASAEKRMKNTMIGGFLGAETASEINVVEKYILGINKSCR